MNCSGPIRKERISWYGAGVSDPLTRRGFIKGLAGFAGIVGAEAVFHHNMPAGLIPAVFADSEEPFVIEGKSGLRVLNDRPLNAETPAHLLNDDVTPMETAVCTKQRLSTRKRRCRRLDPDRGR